ncbi:DUF4148 domain-containing protein [Burkholderia ubonensis]|uniref:DUF4148 domain-containing protein n=1 Tax=Burkholderia ubonensis TaxID=101571 RepID=UPI0009B406B0
MTVVAFIIAFAPMAIGVTQAGGLTREEVKAELAELRALGYRSTAEDPHYPRHIQEMMAKLHEKRAKKVTKTQEGTVSPQSSTGDRSPAVPVSCVDDQESCVGPASLCSKYLGS